MRVVQNKPFLPPYDEYVKKIKGCWESYHLTNNGDFEREFSDKLATRGLSNPELVVNGHAALELALDALNLSGEVITTPFTFISTTNAIVRRGLTPVFADIDAKTFNILPSSVEQLITPKTTAILAVHVFGAPCDTYQLESIAKKHNIKLIYDAAHSFGTCLSGKDISHYGDISIFSFHATKLFHSVEGGVVCCESSNIAKKIASLRNFGVDGKRINSAGMNAKMHEFSAAMGLVNLNYVDEVILKRKRVFNRYLNNLKDVHGLKFQDRKREKNFDDNYAYFPVVISEGVGVTRDQFVMGLYEKEVEARKYFYPLTCKADYFESVCGSIPVAEAISSSILTLPLHFYITDEEVDFVSQAVIDVLPNN